MFCCRAPEGWFEEFSADGLGLIDPPERVDQPFGHDGVEVGFDEELYDPETGLAGGSSGAVGERQQLRIKVPNVFTQMTLGTAYANADGQGFAHMGFGVETGGHIFMSAGAPGQMGNEPNNRMKLQSHGDMTIYSATGGLNMGALGGMMLGTGGSFTLGADGGVLIAGGTVGACRGADDGFDQLTAGRNIPEIPKWINSANTVTTVIGAALAGYDAYVGVSGVVRPMKRKSALGLTDSPSPTVKTALAATGVGLIGAFASFSGALSGSLSAFFDVKTPTVLANAIAGTTIWGEKGWIAGTLLTMGLYSGAGTTFSSYKGVSIMGEAVAIDAKTDVEITGKSGKIAFDEGIELITGNTLRLGARKGGVGISGATIGIGDIVASGKQSETKELALTAKVIEIGGWDGVTVSGGKSATVEAGDGVFVVSKLASVWGKDTACLGGKEVYVDGTSSVRVASGPSAIHIDSSGVLLTHKASGKSDEYKKAAEHLGKLEGELKKINDQYKDLKARSIRDNGRVTGLGPIKTHLGGVEAARDDVRNQMKKITKIVDKSAALHVKKGGVFFKFGSHEFKITKQGFENASMKAAK